MKNNGVGGLPGDFKVVVLNDDRALVSSPAFFLHCLLLGLLLGCGAATGFSATNILVVTNDPFCAIPLPGTNQPGPGTTKMIARMQDLLRKADPVASPYLNMQLVDHLRKAKAEATNGPQSFRVRVQLALQLVRAGLTVEGLREFDELPPFIRDQGLRLSRPDLAYLKTQRGLAFLRLGEQDNCLLNHTSESCLFPIQGAGLHQNTRGSAGAIEVFNQVLKSDTNDLAARWLLNIAYMTLGEYPAQVPPAYLIPPSAFASEYNLPRFPEAAAAAGLDVDDLAGGCIAEDFDGDGLLDVMASSWSLRGQLRFFHNNGDGTFADRTHEAGLWGVTGCLNMMQTDFNNDGHPDVFLLRGAWLGKAGQHPNSLLRNNGNGTFEDVTEAAGLLSFRPTQAGTWFDFDGDGWLDLFIGNESYGPAVYPCELYHNNGNGTFTECAAASGITALGFIKGVTSGDFDNDGRPDLYISCRGEANVLLHNDGPAPGHATNHLSWHFTDVTQRAGVAEPMSSFPCWFFDYDNDGRLDIFVTGYAATVASIAADYLGLPNNGERARLYHNNGDGTFRDVTKEAGLYRVLHAMGANYGDFDNDGWLDFYLGTGDPDLATLIPNRAFRNNGGTNFQDVTTAGGFGHLQKGHGITFADFDNDGRQDIYAVMGGAYTGDNYRNALFVNPGGNQNHWVTLKLEGVGSNRAAIGARIRAVVQTPRGLRSIYKTVCSGGSFGASPLRQEIGLGDATAIQSVEIFWPATGQTQILNGLTMDRFYRVREGSSQAEPSNLPQFHLATKSDPKKQTSNQHPHLVPLTGP